MRRYSLTLESKLPFGQYKNEKVLSILLKDKSYLKWMERVTGVSFEFDIDQTYKSIKDQTPDPFEEYLDKHPNPFNLERWQLRFAVEYTLCQVKKTGNPTVDDWD